jgi:hypothetical protein
MNKQPSLVKIITIDYAAFVALLFPIITWGIYIVLVVLQKVKTTDFSLLAIYAGITIVAVGVMGWRIQVFNSVFNDDIEVPAIISNVFFFRDRGRIDYVYTHQGQKYASGNAVHKVKQTRSLLVGEQVIVMVDRNNPKRAYIRNLYL